MPNGDIASLLKFAPKEAYINGLMDGRLNMNAADYCHGLPGEQGDPLEASLAYMMGIYANWLLPTCCTFTVREGDIVDNAVVVTRRMNDEFRCADDWIGIVRYDRFERLLNWDNDSGDGISPHGSILYGAPSPTFPRKFADVDWGSRKINPTKYVRSAGLELPSDPIGCSPRGSAMKRPLYYLLCAIACTSMVGATMPMAAIAEAKQHQETAEQQAQVDATSSDTGEAENGTNTSATADTVENSTSTSTDTSAVNTESADATNADTTATPGTAAATGIPTATGTPAPSLSAQTTPTPAAISTAPQTTYAHSATASQNGVTFTVSWNDAPAGTATNFHVTQTNGSSQAKARMDVPTYWDGGSQESVCDPSRPAWASYYSLGTAGHDFTFDFTASGTYRIYFYFMDNDRNDPQNDKGIYYLRTTAEVNVNDIARPSVTQIVNDAVAQCRQETNGSEYDMALWLHDWTLDQLEYDHSLNWCSAESGLTRHQGTCESYQRIYSKLLDAAGIANGRITGNGHTWNAVKIDGKWCQMDLTWDDTSDNWYGDLDQRHLYFGLTDELMAIAHSDHTANYQKADYAYRSTDLSNNYFVRNGKADEWAEKYADRIQHHLDAKEKSFSIDAGNQSFPPSISGIQNGIAAYAMNLREWKTGGAKVELTAASNVTKESNYKWCAKYDLTAKYQNTALERVVDDGAYRVASAVDGSMAVAASASGCSIATDPASRLTASP